MAQYKGATKIHFKAPVLQFIMGHGKKLWNKRLLRNANQFALQKPPCFSMMQYRKVNSFAVINKQLSIYIQKLGNCSALSICYKKK